jgi:septal ring factor EnvC (AmiA/AmiB activator)
MVVSVETFLVVSLTLAVFSAVVALGSSLVLGIGFERLRSAFEVVRKQTGFFSDAIHKLEEQVTEVGTQTNNFTASVAKLEQKVDIVDKQTSYFSNAIHKLDQKIEAIETVAEKLEEKTDAINPSDVLSIPSDFIIPAGYKEATASGQSLHASTWFTDSKLGTTSFH